MSQSVTKKPLLITTGEPAGIGLDVVITGLLAQKRFKAYGLVVVIASVDALSIRAEQLGLADTLVHVNNVNQSLIEQTSDLPLDALNVLDLPCTSSVEAGVLNPNNAQHVLDQLTLAAKLAQEKKVAAIITAPIQKSIINDAAKSGLVDLSMLAGYFSGHTEFFQRLAGCSDVVMMLANRHLKVALVTTHLPLCQVPAAVTHDKLTTTIDILLQDLSKKFAIKAPKILVCGLNPHAGEDGYLGNEEIDIINPVLRGYQKKGIDISLAQPADTLFSPDNMAYADAFLAMYHDQGLVAVKTLGFGETVNLTLGLPYIRTSVDHGTALDLAGSGLAKDNSFLAALTLAAKIADTY